MKLAPLVVLAAAALMPPPSAAQQGNTATGVRDELLAHFDVSMRKFIALAEAMPADRFTWKPQQDAMEVAQVYAHVANYNYYYPATALGIATPPGIDRDTLEAMRDKAQIVRLLRASAEHVRRSVAGMPAAQLEGMTKLYGRDVPRWAVLVQLVSHMNEHLGQSIAYARANEIVPPWSR